MPPTDVPDVPFHANGYIIDEPVVARRSTGGALMQPPSRTTTFGPIAPPDRAAIRTTAVESHTEVSSTRCRFLELPLSVRKSIFQHVVPGDRFIVITVQYPSLVTSSLTNWSSKVDITPRQPTLFLVNKQVRGEVTEVYYGDNSFFFTSIADANHWLEHIGSVGAVISDVCFALPAGPAVEGAAPTAVAYIHIQTDKDTEQLQLTASEAAAQAMCEECQGKILSLMDEVNVTYAQLKPGRRVDDKLRVFVAWLKNSFSSGPGTGLEYIAEWQKKGGMKLTTEGKAVCRLCRWNV